MTEIKPSNRPYKPSDFLRERRPERYSDTVVSWEPKLAEDLLEYHLDTLTSRNQEKAFEMFARRLAEKEICPNLLPQTGPTGGGDSKVDTETYPVADEIAIRWYQGVSGGKERWGFAFSAKEKWREKAKSDVRNIAGTNRDYSLIYFISSRFIRDKNRADLEDQLQEEVGIPVRVLGRGWIVERVFAGNHIELAVQTLGIESLQHSIQKRVGPLDAQRESELREIDGLINNPDRYQGVQYQLAEDCLQAAILASELERDRHEVDGRFYAARRIAEQVGDQRQLLRISYRHAWVSCFVYDDILELSKMYDEVERLALDSTHAEDVERIHNLLNVLSGAVRMGNADAQYCRLVERGKVLSEKLEELSGDDLRPNNALHARTILCMHHLLHSKEEGREAVFEELNSIFNKIRGLGQFPFESYRELMFELGDFVVDSEGFERLFKTIVELLEERRSEGEAGVALCRRGVQKLRAKRKYEAIKLFGESQGKLLKEEFQEELIQCLVACGGAYDSVGLYWAARSSLLAALSICIRELDSSGVMYDVALPAAEQLAWIELKLGRYPHFLFSLMLVNFVAKHLQIDGGKRESYHDFIQHIDAVSSILLLRSDLKQLDLLGKLPYVLSDFGLICSEGTLLFALGQLEILREDVWFDVKESDEDIERFYGLFSNQPAYSNLPDAVEFFSESRITLNSNVLGVSLIVGVDNNPTSLLLAESLLGALEAFLSTSMKGGIIPHKPNARVNVCADELIEDDAGIVVQTNDKDWDLVVAHRKDCMLNTVDQKHAFKDIQVEFIITLLSMISTYDEDSDHLRKLVEEEKVFDRSLTFTDLVTLNDNVAGGTSWMTMAYWLDQIESDGYKLLRSKVWAHPEQSSDHQETLTMGEGTPPDEIADLDGVRHDERKIISLIDVPAWDKGRWHGSFFMVYPDGGFPPCIGLVFKHKDAARKIFEGWLKDLGKKDTEDHLRVSIITGIDKDNPAHYRMHIGSNINSYKRTGEKGHAVMVSRIQTMTPETTANLEMFLAAYKNFEVYCLMPGVMNSGQNEPELIRDLFLIKKSLVIRPAWQVGLNDEDFVTLQDTDQPIIPAGVVDAPVLEALARKRQKK